MHVTYLLTYWFFKFPVPVKYFFVNSRRFYCRAMRCISAAYAVMRCPSVRLSVTFVDHVKTNKHTFEIF